MSLGSPETRANNQKHCRSFPDLKDYNAREPRPALGRAGFTLGGLDGAVGRAQLCSFNRPFTLRFEKTQVLSTKVQISNGHYRKAAVMAAE